MAGVTLATVAFYVLHAGYFALIWWRRPGERPLGLFSLLCLALAEAGLARVLALHGSAPDMVAQACRANTAGLTLALPLMFHFAVTYGRVESGRRYLPVVYAVAVLFVVVGAAGLLDDRHPAIRHHPWGGLDWVEQGPAPTLLASALHVGGLALTVGALVLFARGYLEGRRYVLPIMVGNAVLVGALGGDAGHSLGLWNTAPLTEVGFLAFAMGVPAATGLKYVEMAQELQRRGAELRRRTGELRRSYEDLRVTQEELVRKEQLAVVGELAAVIAHEVRNPLAIIGNAVAGLRKAHLPRSDHDTLLSILDEETSRLNRLVSDLLRYARPVNLQGQPVDVREVLQRGLHLAREARTIQVQVIEETKDFRVWADANLLRQVFDNLVDNAVQAMGSDGQLTVRLRAHTEDGTEGVAVDVVDTGEGMDTQVRSRAKDPFFTTRPSGTGLGLAIVDRIVEAHGGRLTLDSRAGEGTTVTVFLPQGRLSEGRLSEPPRRPSRPASVPTATPSPAPVALSPAIPPKPEST